MYNLSSHKSLLKKRDFITNHIYFSRQWPVGFIGFIIILISVVCIYWTQGIRTRFFVENDIDVKQSNSFPLTITKQLSKVLENVVANVNASEIALLEDTDLRAQQEPFSRGPFDQLFSEVFFKNFFQFSQHQKSIKIAELIPINLPLTFSRAPPGILIDIITKI